MKKFLKYSLVVEGKEDASYLSNYIASEIVVLNGYELAAPLISYLKDKTVIVLTDPDEAGKKIRQRLNEILNKVINVEIDINKCNRGIKNGVAECDIKEVLTKLEPYFVNDSSLKLSINNIDLYNLGISENKELREYICEKLNLGICNNKQLLKRLANNNVQLDVLEKVIKQYKNGN